MIDPKKPTALLIGRYQPFHDGHKALVMEALARVGQVCIAVRDTGGNDARNPYDYPEVERRIRGALGPAMDRVEVMRLPNVTNVFYGRDVGYAIEKIELGPEVEHISASRIRANAE